jgi:hypothetical protein
MQTCALASTNRTRDYAMCGMRTFTAGIIYTCILLASLLESNSCSKRAQRADLVEYDDERRQCKLADAEEQVAPVDQAQR